jgi:hypothetical protein
MGYVKWVESKAFSTATHDEHIFGCNIAVGALLECLKIDAGSVNPLLLF